MVGNENYSSKLRTMETTVYTGSYAKYVCRILTETFRKLGIMSTDCKISHEDDRVNLEFKDASLRSRLYEISRKTLSAKIHSKSKRPTNLRSEVESPLFLRRED